MRVARPTSSPSAISGAVGFKGLTRVVQFLDQQAARAFHEALGRVDAGVVLVGELPFEGLECLLKHRRVPPVRAERFDPGIPIRAHAALGAGPRTKRARSRRSIS